MDRVLNVWIRELCRVKKGLDERIDEGNVERMERGRIVKTVYIGECAGIHPVGTLQKSWTDTVKECLRKRGLDQAS